MRAAKRQFFGREDSRFPRSRDEAFSERSPPSGDWLQGFFGSESSTISLSAGAITNSARVERLPGSTTNSTAHARLLNLPEKLQGGSDTGAGARAHPGLGDDVPLSLPTHASDVCPHSGHLLGVARRSYPQTVQIPLRSRNRRRLVAAIQKNGAIDSAAVMLMCGTSIKFS
jgi:hypothetical protein